MAAAPIGGAIVIDIEEGGKGKEESLFGPSIGIVNTGPEWTALNEKRLVEDELTQDVVKGWVEKSQLVSGARLSYAYRVSHPSLGHPAHHDPAGTRQPQAPHAATVSPRSARLW